MTRESPYCDALVRIFGSVLGCGDVRGVTLPGTSTPVLGFRFSPGGATSLELVRADAPDSDAPRLGAWLEIRTGDLPALRRAVPDAGLPEVEHPGHEFCFVVPGGQVFAVMPIAT